MMICGRTEKSEITHRNGKFAHLSDEELIRKLRDEANALLLEHEAKLVDVTPEEV